MTSSSSNIDEEYERVLVVKSTVYIYQIPPLTSASRGFKASDWNLDQPNFTGRLRLISKGEQCFLKLEDSNTGALYCQAPISAYPGPQVQPVVDSRRYFVVKVVSDTGRTALIGIGFADGADSFDLGVALQDHFSAFSKANQSEVGEEDESKPKLDLSLKGDVKLTLNIGGQQRNRTSRPRANNSEPGKPFLLPPPPNSTRK